MSVLFVTIPIALLISLLAVVAFVRQVQSGQFDDLETPPRRMLFDDAENSNDNLNAVTNMDSTDTEKFADPPPTQIECAGRTDIGKKRQVNQDQYLIADLHKGMRIQDSSQPFQGKQLHSGTMGKLLVVADGMGGAQAGEVASELAIHVMGEYLLNSMHWLFHPKQLEIEQFIEDLKKGAMRSHELVRNNAGQDPELFGMGTTLTVAYLMWPMLFVLHIGDSRCYVLRNGSLQMLTKDQTLAQHLLDAGRLEGDEVDASPYQHILLSAIGAEGEPDAIVYKTRLLAGDRIMLCSDGVNAHLSDTDIEKILAANISPDEICQKIVDTANDRGGNDNITVVVAVSKRIS